MNKKANLDLFTHWVEWCALLLLVAGLYFALLAGNAPAIYGLAFLAGLFFGREFFRCRQEQRTMLFSCILLAGLVIGLFLGAWAAGVQKEAVLLLVIAGIALGYIIHNRGII